MSRSRGEGNDYPPGRESHTGRNLGLGLMGIAILAAGIYVGSYYQNHKPDLSRIKLPTGINIQITTGEIGPVSPLPVLSPLNIPELAATFQADLATFQAKAEETEQAESTLTPTKTPRPTSRPTINMTVVYNRALKLAATATAVANNQTPVPSTEVLLPLIENNRPTPTPEPTATSTATATLRPTNTPIPTDTATATNSPEPLPTSTSTSTSTITRTATATWTATATETDTPIPPTATFTVTPSPFPSPSPSETAFPSPTPQPAPSTGGNAQLNVQP